MRRCACWSGARGPAASLAGRVQAARVVGKPGSTTHTSDVGAIKPPKPTVLVTAILHTEPNDTRRGR
jgi:hypothetical protein